MENALGRTLEGLMWTSFHGESSELGPSFSLSLACPVSSPAGGDPGLSVPTGCAALVWAGPSQPQGQVGWRSVERPQDS